MINETALLCDKYFPDMVKIRRTLHMYPETAFLEYRTSEYIKEVLKKLNIPYKSVAKTGIVADITGSGAGKTLAFRADMDALDIYEENDVPYKSKTDGVMHACGHDAHMATLLGAAMVLNELKDKIKGKIRLIFQPAEEGDGGALPMIKEGALEGVSAVVAAHVMSDIPCGKVLVKEGAIMASCDDFKITVIGRGGHGAYPHKTIDPIVIGANIVNGLQKIVSRKINPLEPCVITVGYFHAGTCTNVIPGTAEIGGTFRALSNEVRESLPKLIEECAKNQAKSFGGDCDVKFFFQFAPVINDKHITQEFAKSCKKAIGNENVIWGTPLQWQATIFHISQMKSQPLTFT